MALGRDHTPTVVVLRALGLGDLLTAVPALRALAAAHPTARRLLACPAFMTPLVALVDPVLEVVDVDLRECSRFPPLPGPLRGADLAVNLHGRGPQSTAALVATDPAHLVAFGEPGCAAWRADEHEVRRWCRLLDIAGIPADPADLLLDLEVPRGDATVVHPGAASTARRWPADRWAAVARAERERGRDVVVTGAASEVELAHRVAAGAGLHDDAVLAGRTGLGDLVDVVAGAGRVVCGDTGVAHLATATATPSVVLFGPVPPAEWGPPDSPRHVVLWAGRRGDPHAGTPDPGLLEIAVGDVVAAVAALDTVTAR